MKLSINANYLVCTRDPNRFRTAGECLALCRRAGFRTFDYSPYLDCEGWEESIDSVIRAADALGVELEQSHAPYNYYAKRTPEHFSVLLDRSVKAAIRMKNRQLVFHMDEYHAPSPDAYDPDAALDRAYEVLAPHIEKALASGVRVALETIFEDRITVGKPGRSHFGGTLDELLRSLDRFRHPDVGCCWDFGHAYLAYGREGQLDAMRTLGSRIICTHTHDNYYTKDLHLMPFWGEQCWERVMQTLAEIGYRGNLTYEFVYGRLPDRLIPAFLDYAHDTGEVLIDLFDGKEG